MGLGLSLQKTVVNLLFANKEKLLAIFIERLNKEYFHSRGEIASLVLRYLPTRWKETATEEEVAQAIDCLKRFVEEMYGIIQQMQKPPIIGPEPPRKMGRV